MRTALSRTHRQRLIAIGAVAVLALSVLAGIAIARPSGHGYAAPIVMLTTPFPSSVVGSHPPEPTASPSSSPRAHGAWPSATPHPSMTPVITAPATPSTAMTTAPAVASPSATATQSLVTVSYFIVARWYDEFESEITIANTGTSAISGWQLVVALPYDQFAAVSADAVGYVSNHILLLQPASYEDSVPANGTLAIFFTAYGTSTTPELCAFDNIYCALWCAASRRR